MQNEGGRSALAKTKDFQSGFFKIFELQKILNTIEINFSGVGFVCIGMKAFLLEVILYQRFIFPLFGMTIYFLPVYL